MNALSSLPPCPSGRLFAVGVSVAISLSASGCVSVRPESAASIASREQRRAEASLPLAGRAAVIERDLFTDFLEPSLGLVADHLVVADGRIERGPVNIEQNAHLLAGLACQYAVTRSTIALERARRVVAGLDELDRANGFDGFFPFEATVGERGVEITGRRFISSSCMQLLFAQVLAWRLLDDESLREQVRRQAARMVDRVIAHGLVVVDEEGRPMPFSDMSPGRRIIGVSRELDTLVYVRAAIFFADDDPGRRTRLESLRRHVEDELGYASLPFVLHFQVPFLELPTPSSSWLNIMKLATLVEMTGEERYRRLLHGLAGRYRRQQNPFFIALDLLHAPDVSAGWREARERTAWRRLDTYPITRGPQAMSNLGNPDYPRRGAPRFIKNAFVHQSRRPIAFYDLQGDRYLWKRDLLRLNPPPVRKPAERLYPGVDFHEAYWLLALAGRRADGR